MARAERLPARLLVDLPNWLGDVVMAMPAVERLLAADSGEIAVLHCRPAVRRLLELVFPDARVVATPRHAGPAATARALCRRGGRFPLAVTFRHSLRARLLLRCTARHRVGSREGGGRVLLDGAVDLDRSRHQVEDGQALLDAVGAGRLDPCWRPIPPAEVLAEGKGALDAAAVDDEAAVGLVPAAAWGPAKQWPAERFGDLARRLAGAGRQPVVLIGPGEEGVAAAVRAAAGLDLPVLGPALDVAGLYGVLAHVGVVVSNDTGPMHLAALAGARLVALFGPTDPARTAPLGAGHAVLSRHLECAPCFTPRCPLGHGRCMADITVDEVEAAVQRIVAGG